MKKLLSVYFVVFLFGCSSIDSAVTIPDDILSNEKMAEIMVDIHLLEATLNISTYSKDHVVMNAINPNSDILKKNNITQKQYKESFEFYAQNPVLLTEVYQLVLNSLSKMQAEVMNNR
jgi:hypothetical protein